MNTVEESGPRRTVTKRNNKLGSLRYGGSGSGSSGSGGGGGGGGGNSNDATDWTSSTTPTSGVRDSGQVVPTAADAWRYSSASLRTHDPLGPPSRRSDNNLDSTARQATPDRVDFFFKVMLLGDSGVGKTCLLTRFHDSYFLSGNYITTVGIDFKNKVVNVDESRVKLQIWDTAGQERFRSVTHAYYRDAHALLLLYDVTNKTSFDNVRAWLSEIREYANEDVVIMLLGNKSDCGQERVVKREDGERLASEYKVPFMETSAKTGLNVELAFLAVARELRAKKRGDPDDTKFNVQDYVRQQSKRNSCFNSNCLTT